MSPDQISALMAIASAIKMMANWPFGAAIAAAILGPWIFLLYISRSLDKRVGMQKQMYDSNVELVKNYEKLAGELTSIIHLNTQVQTNLVERISNNQYCPVVRAKGPQP